MLHSRKQYYPKVMGKWRNAPIVTAEDNWVSQEEACRLLGIGYTRLSLLITAGHLHPAQLSTGGVGVSRESLEVELSWRASSGVLGRVGRRLRDSLRWI